MTLNGGHGNPVLQVDTGLRNMMFGCLGYRKLYSLEFLQCVLCFIPGLGKHGPLKEVFMSGCGSTLRKGPANKSAINSNLITDQLWLGLGSQSRCIMKCN